MACCQERNLPDTCLSKCSFRSYTRDALQVRQYANFNYSNFSLQAMYFKQDSCPMQAAADIHFCAAQVSRERESVCLPCCFPVHSHHAVSQGNDHTECCARNGVATTLAGSKCMTFCDQRPGNVTQVGKVLCTLHSNVDIPVSLCGVSLLKVSLG